ncbi:MAG: type I methionyl aminopeptidase [Patescibacteria group bacterium]
MRIKNEKELKILREGGRRLADIMNIISQIAAPGIAAAELDRRAEELILKQGGFPAFKGYKTSDAKIPYPSSLCVSVNDEIVHAPPSVRILKDGDIASLDLGMEWKGFYTDMAVTVPIGNVDKKSLKLIKITKKALELGISAVKNGGRVGDIGFAVESYVKSEGFCVVKELVGHGVGRQVHEKPEIPNWGKKGAGFLLEEGMVLALEPMVNAGAEKIKLAEDGWTWKTADGSRSAHFEHTVAITKDGAEILTRI